MQVHGFARNCDWALAGAKDDNGNPGVTLVLTDNDYTRGMWPAAFKVGVGVGGWGGRGGLIVWPALLLVIACRATWLHTHHTL